ncbi:beta-phosphoglucomutase [Hypnocyclicus thermotrophus]|uniref:Beta-phosphoglucomutase n=1 Tax=Hypnocyclicus thermotrophus TaxID=1627895 RepID=A0AA46I532_9FUSO|nr:beta-phosphoglucomutase [Hypnocyclicus thermotrophus]TDT68057.1 beta-phosphoglucomutase [Hypnocyclicus thermotrophus]
MRDIELFIFDLDGVITDTAEYHYLAWKELCDDKGLLFNREVNEKLRGVSRLDSIKIIMEYNKKDDVSEIELIEWATEKNERYKQLIQKVTPNDLIEGITEIFNRLKNKNIKIALGSASKNAKAVIKNLGIEEIFDFIGDGYSVDKSKPAPDLFLYVAKNLNISPGKCVVVEDALAGIEAAKSAGMLGVAIGKKEDFKKADFVYNKIKDINLDEILK